MSPPRGPGNRLGDESSPYLLLHKDNPVDWLPWGEEAFARARDEDRPIFLSVGYSTCYWCHVMERESFSDPRTAELMNRTFVNVKVDREERPDVDEIYMTATQILTGQGGWPNSVFLTPRLEPFYAGTYFPPEDRHGRPGFRSLLRGLAEAWTARRDEVEQQAEELAGAMRRYLEERVQPGEEPPPAGVAAASYEALVRRFDPEWPGFSQAPKFPTPSNLFLLLELAGEEARAGEMLRATLDAMARGGLFDQLGGGFHRYATDRAWRVPHFEKMLYDNALLLELYAREHARTGDPEAGRVARATAGFLEREMSLPDGGFASAIDAETDGREGAYYVWGREELEQVLGAEERDFLAPLYGFDGPPFFAESEWVLHLPEPLAAAARRRRMEREELLAEIEPLRRRLLAARGERPRPRTDDKVLADWNGMAVGALAVAGRLLDEPAWVERAARAADFVLDRMRPGGVLHHTWRAGTAKVPALLGDYAWMVRGLLALARSTGAPRWRAAAAELAEEQEARLAAPGGGWYVAAERPDLLLRTRDLFDGAVPAAEAVAVLDLLALAAADPQGAARWRGRAGRALTAAAPLVEQLPDGARTFALAARRFQRTAAPLPGGAAVAGAGVVTATAAPAAAAGGAADLERRAAEVVAAELAVEAPGEGGWRRFRLRLTLADGWHALAPAAGGEGSGAGAPLRLGAVDAELRDVRLPPGAPEELAAGAAVAVYRGRVDVTGEVRPRQGAAAPALELRVQPCDARRCLPAVARRLPLD